MSRRLSVSLFWVLLRTGLYSRLNNVLRGGSCSVSLLSPPSSFLGHGSNAFADPGHNNVLTANFDERSYQFFRVGASVSEADLDLSFRCL